VTARRLDPCRAVSQVLRHYPRPVANEVVLAVYLGEAGSYAEAIRQAPTVLLFRRHPDLLALDAVLDDAYPEAL
jgi:hypothetical protein